MKKFTLTLFVTLLVGIQVVLAQDIRVTGTVRDEGGAPMIGVTVLVEGTQRGTTTSSNGSFVISAPANGTLEFTFLGMVPVRIPVSNRTSINVVMENDTQLIDDVVVIGYGSVNRAELTGAVSQVSSDDLKAPVANLAQALQGKVSGLQVVSTSGRTGDETQVSLRGNGSLRASNNVLYVIDGVPMNTMAGISPGDIESLTVLKDAASAAIYGSRASNGVVLVTTRSGKYDQPTQFTFNAYVGFQRPVDEPDLLNAAQYKQVHDAARLNYEQDIAAGIVAPPKDPSVLTPFVSEGADTDWIDLISRDNPLVQNYELGVSGGSSKTKFYLGGRLFSQEGIVKKDKYTVANIKLNLDHRISERVKIGVRSSFASSDQNPLDQDNSIYSPWNAAQNARPDVAPYDANGVPTVASFTNPLWGLERDLSRKWYRLYGTGFVDITILDGLVLHSTATANINQRRQNRYDAPNTRRGQDGSGVPTGYGEYESIYQFNYVVENTLTYTNTAWDRLHYTVLAGNAYQKDSQERASVKGENFPSSSLKWLNSAGLINGGGSDYMTYALSSFFGRVQLNWDNRYNLMASVRGDGSSKFLKDNQWGTFFAVSGGWNISNEAFFNIRPISTLKLRASFGQTGNQEGIGYYSGQNLIASGSNYNGLPGLSANAIFNENLTWETGEQVNIGLDLGFLKDRFTLTVNYYNKRTKDLLWSQMVPSETGFMSMIANAGNMRNTGFEIEFAANIMKRKDFSWDAGFNFTHNKNKIIKLSGDSEMQTTGFATVLKKGGSIADFYLLESLGVAQERTELKNKDGVVKTVIQPGDMLYRDVNGDGIIGDADRQVFKGGIPPMFGGVYMNFFYKNFDLNVVGQYSFGKKIYRLSAEGQLNGGNVGSPAFSDNMLTEIMNYWTPDNRNTGIPRPHLGPESSAWNLKRSTRFLDKANYFRFADITLGYTFDTSKTRVMKSVRLYVQGRNLFTITPYKGLDPEVHYVNPDYTDSAQKYTAGTDQAGIPNIKSFIVGVNLTF